MIDKNNSQPDVNSIGNPVAVFLQYYNKNIPSAFPQATREMLDEFKTVHPALFKGNGEWVIEKHRKKLMDWLTSHTGDK